MQIPSIAFVGAGPTTIYTLTALLKQAPPPFAVTVFEQQPVAGRGSPYRPGWNDPAMLSNIASLEIPPIEDTLVAWLGRQPESRLLALGIEPLEVNDRAFYPRLALGEYFKDQFKALVARAERRGIAVEVRTRCRVIDAAAEPESVRVFVRSDRGDASEARFDHLVLATGHQWPQDPQARPGYFLSPWPASRLEGIPPCSVGIRGSSLSAIDAAVALALAHGSFVEDGSWLTYAPGPVTEDFHLTMLSRKGLLPEADFFHPIPYEPLAIFTPAAVDNLITSAGEALLDETFSLFKRELISADRAYAEKMELADVTLEAFCDRYFADRIAEDPFAWAKQNLQEAQDNFAAGVTVPWRYAILRMHEVIAAIVPELDDAAFQRFTRYFKPIFVDEYATVPHASIKRMLALHRAGKLDILAVGNDYRIDGHRPEGGAVVRLGGRRLHFPVFIEATGQRPLGATEFSFPSLRQQGLVRDEPGGDVDGSSRGIAIDDQFHLVSVNGPAHRLFCLSLPFILGRHPFVQGITSSHEIGEVVAKELSLAIGRTAAAHNQVPADPDAVKERADFDVAILGTQNNSGYVA